MSRHGLAVRFAMIAVLVAGSWLFLFWQLAPLKPIEALAIISVSAAGCGVSCYLLSPITLSTKSLGGLFALGIGVTVLSVFGVAAAYPLMVNSYSPLAGSEFCTFGLPSRKDTFFGIAVLSLPVGILASYCLGARYNAAI